MKILRYLVIVLFLICDIVQNGYGFGYGRNAEFEWRKDHHGCGGMLQSPIRINSWEAKPMGMPALETIRYHDLLPGELILQNNGHSIALSVKRGEHYHMSEYYSEIPYIFGGLLSNEYVFEGLHFHWGARNNRGSEHILDDIQYPVEMHLIHRNRNYKDIHQALKHKDGLTVLGIFFQLTDKKNEEFENVLNYFPLIRNFKENVTVNSTLMLSSLIPADINKFYTYKGSLTTPPCSEVVTWIVFAETLPISLAQLNEFRKISDESGKTNLMDNYRHWQSVGQRQIFVREPLMKHSAYFSPENFLKWNWFTTNLHQNRINRK